MKVAFMLRNLAEKGGIFVYTTNLIENILRIENDNEYVLIYPKSDFVGTYSSNKNVKEIVVKAPSKLLWDQVAVPYVLAREKVQLVFNPKLSIPVFTRAKKLLMIHGAEQFAVKETFPWHDRIYVQLAMPTYARIATRVLTTTQLGVNDLSRCLRIDESKFSFVHEGVHARFKRLADAELEGVKKKYNLPDRYLLFVGGISPLKNFHRILQAFDQVADKTPCSLVVVGFKRWKFDADMAKLEAIAERHGERLVLPGFVPDEDLPAFYNMADALVFPSLYEGFGLPVLEAMACSCPVIASKAGCTREVTGDAALLVDPYDVNDLVDAILTLDKDGVRQDLIRKGLERVRHFSWEKCARETLDVFRQTVYGEVPAQRPVAAT